MRGKAIGGGRAEAKTSEPLRELGSAEAVIRQRGGFVLKECGQAVGNGCIVCCCISGGEVGGQDKRPASRRGEGNAGEAGRGPRVCAQGAWRHKGVVPEGGAEHGDPLALWWESPVPNPDWLGAVISTQVCDVARLLAG